MNDAVRLFPVHGPDVEGLHPIVDMLGVAGDGDRFGQQLPGRPPVEGQNLPLLAQPFGVGKASGVDPAVDGEVHLVAPAGGGEPEPQRGNKQVLQLIVGGQGTGAGDDLQAGGQRPSAQLGQQQAGGRAILVLDGVNAGAQGLQGLVENHRPLRCDGGQEPALFLPAPGMESREFPIRDSLRRPDDLGHVGAVLGDTGAVPQQGRGRAHEFAAAGVQGGTGVGRLDDVCRLPVKPLGVHATA